MVTKSLYMAYRTCPLAAHRMVYNPSLAAQLKADELARIEDGIELNILARELCPGGIDASKNNSLFGQAAVNYTHELIESGVRVIYEAAFQSADKAFFFKADILDLTNSRIIEVKSTGKVMDEHTAECGFYEFVLAGLGFRVERYYIACIDTNYLQLDKPEPGLLFYLEDITGAVRTNQGLHERLAIACLEVIRNVDEPKRQVGEYCLKPQKCSFTEVCFQGLSHRDSVCNISGMRSAKKFSLIRDGVNKMQQLPKNLVLSDRQSRQVEAHIHGKVQIDIQWLKEFLSPFKGKKVCFLDFETYMTPVPEFQGTRPYQQIPFQYSLHILENGIVEHREFLGEPGSDPREEFIRQLIDDLSDKGIIVVYNKTFEITRIKELAKEFNQYSKQLLRLIERIVDIMIPFQTMHVYSPEMRGSYSLKAVLPAFVSRLTYSDLAINNGALASTEYRRMKVLTDATRKKMRKNLLEYCKMDTQALLEIWRFLYQAVENKTN